MVTDLAGRRVARVERLAWYWPGDDVDYKVGPTRLVFDDGYGLVLAGRDAMGAPRPQGPGATLSRAHQMTMLAMNVSVESLRERLRL